MILYHVSMDLEHDGNFVPRVPEKRLILENAYIPRVATSKTISGCLSAMPFGGSVLFKHYRKEKNITNEKYHNGYRKYKLFEIDTDKLGIPKEWLYNPEQLERLGYCEDAQISKEYWITGDFKVPVKHQTLFILKDFELLDENGYAIIDNIKIKEMNKNGKAVKK